LATGTAKPGMIDVAIQAALRAADLTRSLLAFARRQPLDPRKLDINHRITAMVGILGRTLGEDITVSTALAPDLWPVRVDGAQLDSCIVNLANNARDAMPRGGALTIATRNLQLDEAYARSHPEAKPGAYVQIEMCDTGQGMSPETLALVFEPFFTTKGASHGTGLGLSMVHGFVKQSGGHVDIYSEVGQGTVVRIYLPRDTGEGADVAGGAEPEQQAQLRGHETILVVEDNAPMRQAVAAQLRALGYRALEAADGAAALALLARGDEHIALLFTDIVMPGALDGYELAALAVERYRGIRVLLTSGFPGDIVRRDHRRTDFPLLSKPYRKDDLARVLRKVLDGAAPSEAA
jgi:CheY-like chemotaxis protein